MPASRGDGSEHVDRHYPGAIAIVGFSMRFPGDITTSSSFWDTLMQQRNTATTIPKSRMNLDSIYHPDADRKGQIAVQKGHFLEQDIASFDSSFFNISTQDSANIDPQQRLLLETTYTALENAGIPLSKISGTKTSVFTGSFAHDWMHLAYKDGEQSNTTTALGVQPNFNANRISWFFNLTGSSVNVDTACSSSLVCLDLGCQSLQNGTEDLSIVTGSNIMLSPDNMHALTNLNMLSTDGQSYSFDHRANGYSRGEGIGVLVLKRVADAIRDHDTIRGIIRSTGCNQNGRTPSITLSDHHAQKELIRQTYDKAGLSMEPTRFVEAHGTGTQVGDPNEARAFGSVFKSARTKDDPLWVGALKSNIGHLEGASGVAGVIKALLVLEKAIIPPNANLQKINNKIDADFLRIRFPTAPKAWPAKGLRRASVNSFGNGGTNSHVVLDDVFHFLEARNLTANHITVSKPPSDASLQATLVGTTNEVDQPARHPNQLCDERLKLLVLSSNDANGIQRASQDLARYYHEATEKNNLGFDHLNNLAYTLFARRSALQWKSYAIVRSMSDLGKLDKSVVKPQKSISNPGLAFLFCGQAAQWSGMGKELMSFKTFADSLINAERCLFKLGCKWSLREALFQSPESFLASAEVAQPACTAVQIAIVDLMNSFGVQPVAVIGHSSGEIAAAYCTGAISHAAAMTIAYYRGLSAGSLARDKSVNGAMVAVGLSETDVQPYLDEVSRKSGDSCDLTVACVNSPENVTISGSEEYILGLLDVLVQTKVFAKRLEVDVAYHSTHMAKIADVYLRYLQNLDYQTSNKRSAAMFSTVTGSRITVSELVQPEYWVTNLLSQVRFPDALRDLLSGSARKMRKKLDLSHRNKFHIDMIVEVSPHSVLRKPVSDTTKKIDTASNIRYTSVLIRNNAADQTMLRVIGELFAMGYQVELNSVNQIDPASNSCISLPDLPEYAFDHSQQYWTEPRLSRRYRTLGQGKLDLLGKPELDWNDLQPRWRHFLRVSEMPWLEDHIVNGMAIYPGAGMMVMAIEAANQLSSHEPGVRGFELKEVSFRRPLKISRTASGTETHLTVYPNLEDSRSLESWSQWRLSTLEGENWTEVCTGFIRVCYTKHSNPVDGDRSERNAILAKIRSRDHLKACCRQTVDVKAFYGRTKDSGLSFGTSFRRLMSGMFSDEASVLATIQPYEWPQSQYPQSHVVHPITLDCLLHSAYAGRMLGSNGQTSTMVPTYLSNIFINKAGLNHVAGHQLQQTSSFTASSKRTHSISGFVLDSTDEQVLVEISDLQITTIAEAKETSQAMISSTGHKTYHIERLPDPTLLDSGSLQKICVRHRSNNTSSIIAYIDLLLHKFSKLNILLLDMSDSMEKMAQARFLQDLSHRDAADSEAVISVSLVTKAKTTLELAEQAFAHNMSKDFKLIGPESKETFTDLGLKHRSFNVVLSLSALNLDRVSLNEMRRLMQVDSAFIHCTPSKECLLYNKSPEQLHLFQEAGFTYQGNIAFDANATSPARSAHIYRITSEIKEIVQPPDVAIVLDLNSQKQLNAGDLLKNFLLLRGFTTVEFRSLEDTYTIDRSRLPIFIVLLELDTPFLHNMDSGSYSKIHEFLELATNIVWVNLAGGSTEDAPQYSLVSGLFRALRVERVQMKVSIVSFEDKGQLTDQQFERLIAVLDKNHQIGSSNSDDFEFVEIDDNLTIPRVVPQPVLSEALGLRSLTRHTITTQLQDSQPLKLTIGSPGMLNTLHFVEDDCDSKPLAPDEIEVSVKAIGVNFRDCLIALGRLENSEMGQECAGEVIQAGSDTGYATGDRVIVLLNDVFRTNMRCKASATIKVPVSMPFTVAASFAAQFGTAMICVHRIAQLQPGETILIHTAASGTGQAAIQLAKNIGAVIYVTVGSAMKKQLLMDEYGIPEERIFYSRDTSFASGIKQATNGRGVDVILNSLAGDLLNASWDCVAPCGRFVEIGKKDIMSNSKLSMLAFGKNVSFHAFDGFVWFKEKPKEARADIEKLLQMFVDNSLRPAQPLHVRDVGDVQDVLQTIQSGNEAGKFVLELRPESKVRASLPIRPSYMFSSDATYVVAGGFGGIGRATARWLVSRGVRNLILLSRRGPRTAAAIRLLDELRAQEVTVKTPACDITDWDRMVECFTDLQKSMKPIKGCVQASLVARDRFFSEMSFQDWQDTVSGKVSGSWNLHKIMPSGLDFFIMLSSASGLAGIKGQTNYDAANTYQDALARYRVAHGEKAATFDLGAMIDDGILAEDQDLLARVLAYGSLEGITRQEYYGLLDYYCNPSLPLLMPNESQVAIGLGTGGGTSLESVDYGRQPMLWPLERINTQAKSGEHEVDIKQQISMTASLEEAAQVIEQAIVQKLAQSLTSMQDSSIDNEKPLQVYGVDSLLAIELRNWIAKEFWSDVAVFETQGASTLSTLGMIIAGRSTIEHPAWSSASATGL